MKNLIPFMFIVLLCFLSCSSDNDGIEQPQNAIMNEDPQDNSGLSQYQLDVIDYFKDITLGFEFGGASEITRKWNTDIKIFVGGSPSAELINELETIKDELNTLATDGFEMKIVNDSIQSNYYIFLGSADDYADIYPSNANDVNSNWGLFTIFWNGQNFLYKGHMYVDITRANSIEQRHLLREELTQSLGLGKDSFEYDDSIFQQDWTTTINYTDIDKDIIRLLYHPSMDVGLNEIQVDNVLRDILSNE